MDARRCWLRSRGCASGAEQPGCPAGGTPVLFGGNNTRRQDSPLVEVEDLMKDSDNYGLGLRDASPAQGGTRQRQNPCSRDNEAGGITLQLRILPALFVSSLKRKQAEALYR